MDYFTRKMFEKITKALEPMYVDFDHPDIDEFIAKGNKVEDTQIFTSFPIEHWPHVRTKHGFIPVNYSMYIPKDTMILVNTARGKKAVERFFPSEYMGRW